MFRHTVVDHCLTFLNDVPRNTWYRDRLKTIAPGKNVFEVGCGAGILAAYALESGARHYYGVDINKQRSRFTAAVLDRMGYQGRHTIWCADALNVTGDDIGTDIDVVLCEQTGHQMQNNFTLKQFYQHLYDLFPSAIFLPDCWTLDAYVYEGRHDSDIKEYQPQILLDDPSLPLGYKTALDSYDFIQPSQYLPDLIRLTPENAREPLEFTVDLRTYGSATIVLTDYVSFQNLPCISQSLLNDWPVPVPIIVDRALGRFRFEWDASKRHPNFARGFWKWTGDDF